MSMKCPLCNQMAHTRSSFYASKETKESYYQCRNIECSCTFKTLESVSNIIRRPPEPKKEEPKSVKLPSRLNRYGSGFQLSNRHIQ